MRAYARLSSNEGVPGQYASDRRSKPCYGTVSIVRRLENSRGSPFPRDFRDIARPGDGFDANPLTELYPPLGCGCHQVGRQRRCQQTGILAGVTLLEPLGPVPVVPLAITRRITSHLRAGPSRIIDHFPFASGSLLVGVQEHEAHQQTR